MAKAVVKTARQPRQPGVEPLERRQLFSGLPLHVMLADQLINNIPAANNVYAYGTPTVNISGVAGATTYNNASDCSTYQVDLLEQAYGITSSQISSWTGQTWPQAKDLYNSALADSGFTGFMSIANIQIGDMMFIKYTSPTATDTGHCMMFDSLPVLSTTITGAITYTVTVDDCTADPHTSDTRSGTESGVGRGLIRLYADASGNLSGYAWGTSKTSPLENTANYHVPIFAKVPPAATATGNSWLAAGSQATWNTSTHVLSVTGPSSIVVDPGGDAPVITVTGTSAQLLLMPGANSVIHMSSLTVNFGATATVYDPSTGNLLLDVAANVGNGVVSVDALSRLDLENNDMLIHGGNLATITASITSGFAPNLGGNWKGNGITSSTVSSDTTHLTALGVMLNTNGTTAVYPKFDGFVSGTTDVLVRHTYVGDTNLDGKVDGSDYSLIDNASLTPASYSGWANGDLNFDGVINGSDYTLMDNAFNTQRSQIVFSASAIVADASATSSIKTAMTLPTLTPLSTAFSSDLLDKSKTNKPLILALNL